MLRLLVSLICVLALAPVARAQLVVHVTANGASVYGAEVAAWSDSGRIAMGRTDGAGIVRLPVSVERTPIAFITARRMGFSPGRLSFPSADSVTVWLTQTTTELPTVAVTARPLRCPARSENEAVALWRAAAAHYTAGQDTMYWNYLASVSNETVPAAQRGFSDSPTQLAISGGFRASVREPARKVSRYYGQPLAFDYATYQPSFGRPYKKWIYPIMFGAGAGLFASEYFGEHHTFVVLGRSGEGTTIGFCALSRSEPEIEGELQVGADSTLFAARWTFRMPHDDEDAGGEATFGDSMLDGARYLVAVTSSTWRRVRPGLYEQERHVLQAWKFGHTYRESLLQSWNDRGDKSRTP